MRGMRAPTSRVARRIVHRRRVVCSSCSLRSGARACAGRDTRVTTLCLRPPPRTALPAPAWMPPPRRGRHDRRPRECHHEERPPLPARRTELIVRPLGDDGGHVVKDPRNGAYYNLGPQESFLFARLDGRSTAAAVRAAFAKEFGEELSEGDLHDFLAIARDSGFVEPAPAANDGTDRASLAYAAATPTAAPKPPKSSQSILYWRTSIFDPDRLFNFLEPKLRFIWTRAFLVLSAAFILAAMVLVWLNARELVTRFPHMMRWETFALAWITLVTATTLHEFAHGLTCKHYGGEVHEVGFLLMYFTPCFYCNVSDAWLLREKSKRLWVTFAGGYCDVVLWALAAFAWRLTAQDTAINYLAWVVLSICAARIFFNFNPLLKLDGYYILSDWTGIPNLRQRGLERWTASLRWLLWGAPKPGADGRG